MLSSPLPPISVSPSKAPFKVHLEETSFSPSPLFPFPPTIHSPANKNDSPPREKASGQTIIHKDTCTVVLVAALDS